MVERTVELDRVVVEHTVGSGMAVQVDTLVGDTAVLTVVADTVVVQNIPHCREVDTHHLMTYPEGSYQAEGIPSLSFLPRLYRTTPFATSESYDANSGNLLPHNLMLMSLLLSGARADSKGD